ncbi:TIM barrel protein [Nonomuraea sp. K274]|uniref:TIM barrel protein n=1 Tax=Nonomuraea cypriaca TaxID=1187855 RepID=A0A931F359_9ACTN|nr:TIM barrel protein [Nonomuraea cypriaca]MBF8189398.1 TIM barrel protein [Nonomuraea cypriaca]
MPSELRFDANLKWLFTELPFERRFDAAAAAGFLAVEYASPYEHDPAALNRRLKDAGLEQILINTPAGAPGTPGRSGYACIPGQVAEFRDGVSRALEYAVALGSDFVHVMGGLRPAGVSRDRAFARFVTNIAWAAEQARGTGVRLLLEAQNNRDAPGFILDTQAQAAAVVDAVDADNVGIMFDAYHAQIDEGDLVTKIAELAPYTWHYQVADPPSRHEPGTGEIGWPAVFRAIGDTGYTGWIGCEYRPAGATTDGLGWIEELTR